MFQKQQPKDFKKPVDAATDRASSAATKKKVKRKSSSNNKKEKTVTSKPSDKKAPETTKPITAVAGTGKAKSPAQQVTPNESKDTGSDFNGDKTSRELTAEECDRTEEEDEEIFTLKDEKLVRGFELRRVQSAKRFVEKYRFLFVYCNICPLFTGLQQN